MRSTVKNILVFGGYTVVFLLFFVGYNTVVSPHFETTFDSASILHTETVVEKTAPIEEQTPELPDTQDLTIAFNPEHIRIDATVLDRLRDTITSPFFRSKVTPLQLIMDARREEPRGQVLGNKLILAASLTDDSESVKVLVHELGHIVDIFYLKKGIVSDPSDRFYDISWEAYNVKKKNQKIADFVSGYALSNKYEDFAESFAFYVFHNESFALRAKKNETLKRKYDFFSDYVFDRSEFVGTSFQQNPLASYHWDTTKIPINAKKYLYYIR